MPIQKYVRSVVRYLQACLELLVFKFQAPNIFNLLSAHGYISVQSEPKILRFVFLESYLQCLAAVNVYSSHFPNNEVPSIGPDIICAGFILPEISTNQSAGIIECNNPPICGSICRKQKRIQNKVKLEASLKLALDGSNNNPGVTDFEIFRLKFSLFINYFIFEQTCCHQR